MPPGFSFTTFHLVRFLAQVLVLLGMGYGLLLRRRIEGRRFPRPLAALLLALTVEYAFLFLWFLAARGRQAQTWSLTLDLVAAGTLLGLWLLPPEDKALRRLTQGHIAGLVVVLLLGGLALWRPVDAFLRLGYLLLVLGLLAWAYRRFRRRCRPHGFVMAVAAALGLAALLEALAPWGSQAQGVVFGLASLATAPLLWAWSFVWFPLLPPPKKDVETAAQPPAAPDGSREALSLYFAQLDALLDTASEQGAWDPVPFIVQSVLTWLAWRLGLQREPRAHIPLPQLLSRALERHESSLAALGLQWALQVDDALSLDPALGEWVLELMFRYLLHSASTEQPIELRLQSGRDLHLGPVLYVRLRHKVATRKATALAPWLLPSLLLARSVLLDMGGDWWLDDAPNQRTIWLQIPLHGFGRLLYPPAAEE